MRGFVIAIPADGTGDNNPQVEYYTLSPGNVDILAQLELFPTDTEPKDQPRYFPVVTAADIDNQSKSDPFTKAFAVLQCAWLIVQSITRASHGLPLTELELSTLAFIPCAFLMYTLWSYKPFDSQRAISLRCVLDETKTRRVRAHLELNNDETRVRELDIYSGFELLFGFVEANHERFWPVTIFFNGTAVAFSAIHIIAWNWDFPSATIKTLWRIFSLVATCFPIAWVIVAFLLLCCS
ncbi:hypothetical protein BJX70DRAFT_384443 [Aspergillus crustosus]